MKGNLYDLFLGILIVLIMGCFTLIGTSMRMYVQDGITLYPDMAMAVQEFRKEPVNAEPVAILLAAAIILVVVPILLSPLFNKRGWSIYFLYAPESLGLTGFFIFLFWYLFTN